MIVDGGILSDNINLMVKILGEKLDGILFEDDYMSASKDNITVKADVNMKTNISFVMPIEIAKMIKKLPKQPLKIQHRNREIKMMTKTQVYQFDIKSPTSPKMVVDKNNFREIAQIPFEELQDNIKKVIPVSYHCITSGIGGVMMLGNGKTLNIIGTNTYCLAWYRMKCDSNFKICVDDRIKKLLKIKYSGNAMIYTDNNYVVFKLGNYMISFPIIETKHLNIDKFKNTSQCLHIQRREGLNSVKRFKEIQSVPVLCRAYKQDIILTIKKGENKFAEKIPIINSSSEMDYNGFCFSFNPKYLERILKTLKDDIVEVRFNINGTFATFSDESGMWALAIVK